LNERGFAFGNPSSAGVRRCFARVVGTIKDLDIHQHAPRYNPSINTTLATANQTMGNLTILILFCLFGSITTPGTVLMQPTSHMPSNLFAYQLRAPVRRHCSFEAWF